MSILRVANQTVHFKSSENMSLIKPGSIDLFITSPPYWNLKDYGDKGQIGQSSYEKYLDRLDTVWNECYRVAHEGSVLVINVNTRRHAKNFYPIPFDIVSRMKGWKLWDHVIWYIPNALPQPNHYRERILDNKFESCLVFIKGSADGYEFHKPRVPQKYAQTDPRAFKHNPNGRCLGNVIRIPAYRPPNVKDLGYHVAAYPEELVAFFIELYTKPGSLILDPFLGSGTTLKVAEVMNRRGIGYEVNKDFRGLITQKIQELWQVPDWRAIDLTHSTTMQTGMLKPRKIQFSRSKDSLFAVEAPSSLFEIQIQSLI